MATRREKQLLAIGVTPCVLVSVAAFFVVPWFNSMFMATGLHGAWLPLITRALTATYRWWGVTALITVALWRPWSSEEKRGRAAVGFGLWCSLALFLFGVIGCYAPIFALAGSR